MDNRFARHGSPLMAVFSYQEVQTLQRILRGRKRDLQFAISARRDRIVLQDTAWNAMAGKLKAEVEQLERELSLVNNILSNKIPGHFEYTMDQPSTDACVSVDEKV